jgi:5'-phosphate synthase pdxT subunit
MTIEVGVLALQGDFAAHAAALAEAGATPREVRIPADLEGLRGLVLPGGESTTMLRLMDAAGLEPAIRAFHAAGRPVLGTCAGLILLASEVRNPAQRSLGLLDVTVARNAYGRQADSFEAPVEGAGPLAGAPLEAGYIRAPRLERLGPGVEVLARQQGTPVLVREGNVLAGAFHPELTADRRVHRLFVGMC